MLNDAGGGFFGEREREVRVGLAEWKQEMGDQIWTEGWDDAKAEGSGRSWGWRGEALRGGEEFADERDESFAFWGDEKTTPGTFKELGLERGFNALDLC